MAVSEFKITTTGAQNPVSFADLGMRSFSHPTIDHDLLIEFTLDEIQRSTDVQAAITAGHITAEDEGGNPITQVEGVGLGWYKDGQFLRPVDDGVGFKFANVAGDELVTMSRSSGNFNFTVSGTGANSLYFNSKITQFQLGGTSAAQRLSISDGGDSQLVHFRADGSVEIKSLAAGVVKSAADGTLSHEVVNTAFNKDFGTSVGTIAEGNHTHVKANITDFSESDYVHTTGAETIAGQKTFVEDKLIIDSPNATPNLEFGWIDLVGHPDGYGIQRSDGGGYFLVMPNSDSPQLMMGNPDNPAGQGYVDCDNNRPLNLNTLDTGIGTQGQVRVGPGGLDVSGILIRGDKRVYESSASVPVSPSPDPGDQYFDTISGEWFTYHTAPWDTWVSERQRHAQAMYGNFAHMLQADGRYDMDVICSGLINQVFRGESELPTPPPTGTTTPAFAIINDLDPVGPKLAYWDFTVAQTGWIETEFPWSNPILMPGHVLDQIAAVGTGGTSWNFSMGSLLHIQNDAKVNDMTVKFGTAGPHNHAWAILRSTSPGPSQPAAATFTDVLASGTHNFTGGANTWESVTGFPAAFNVSANDWIAAMVWIGVGGQNHNIASLRSSEYLNEDYATLTAGIYVVTAGPAPGSNPTPTNIVATVVYGMASLDLGSQ